MKKYTNKILLITTCILLLGITILVACARLINVETIKGSGNVITKEIIISDFTKIEVEENVEIFYTQTQDQAKLEFTTDDNLFEYYEINVKENILKIKLKENLWISPTKVVLNISSAQLEKIEIAGNSTFNFMTPFVSQNLDIEMAGSGKLLANNFPISIEKCEIEIAGSGAVQLLGSIKECKIEISGSGDVKALDCEFATLSVEIAGSGDVEANVTEALKVEIAGSGNVKYSGNPKTIEQDIAGSGKITKIAMND